MNKKILLLFTLVAVLASVSVVSATTIYDFKKPADEYIISQVGQKYFNENFEYFGDKPYPEDTPDSNLRIAQYTHKIAVGDYNQDITVTVWFNLRNGVWEIGNGNGTNAEELPNCVVDKTKCMPFQITKTKAIEIAKNGGAFKDGADKYTIKIHFSSGNINSYIWDITTYKSAISGKTATIDLNSGNLISITDWQALNAKPEYKNAVTVTGERPETNLPPTGTKSPVGQDGIPTTTIGGEKTNLPPTGTKPLLGGVTAGESGRTIVLPSTNGKCRDAYITSVDGKDCLKINSYTGSEIPIISSSGFDRISAVEPSDGKCPEDYILNDENGCSKELPTMFVSPTTGNSSVVTFSSLETKVNDITMKKEIIIAPTEELKVVVNGQIPITLQREETGSSISISRNKVVALVKAEEVLKVDGEIITVSGQEVKIMPDIIMETVSKELEVTEKIQKIELKTKEIKEETHVLYEVTTIKKAKMLGLFKIDLPIITSVDAQTGVIEDVKNPWWNFLVF